jgi:Family of unknown function (DUF6807)
MAMCTSSSAQKAAVTGLLWIMGVGNLPFTEGAVAAADHLVLRVESGRFARRDTPVRIDVPTNAFPLAVAKALGDEPKRLLLREIRGGEVVGEPITVQAERQAGSSDDHVRLTWILAGSMPAQTSRTFRLELMMGSNAASPWLIVEQPPGSLELSNRNHPVFRYNMAPVSNPKFSPVQARNAYIHPAFSPSGALITGDFSQHHTHHRGFFLAYTKTQVGDLHPDFWNFQLGSGKIHFDRLEPPVAGPVTARFSAHHRWEATGGGVVLREQWDVEAYDIPGNPYWLFDLTSTQQATGKPLELIPYRYGGMAYRGPEPFETGDVDVLTSEGRGRLGGDQKPARWVDQTGPIADRSDRFAGAMIADHPQNVTHPTVARIHPEELPFFTYVPGHDIKVTIGAEKPTIFRYRILIHDGHPDAKLDEEIWRDFAEPPKLTLE